MNTERNIASKITIRKVEQGEARYRCHPKGVQVLFVESTMIPGSNMEYLKQLFESKGYTITEGEKVENIPFYRICVQKNGPQIFPSEVFAVLEADPEVDVSQVQLRPEE